MSTTINLYAIHFCRCVCCCLLCCVVLTCAVPWRAVPSAVYRATRLLLGAIEIASGDTHRQAKQRHERIHTYPHNPTVESHHSQHLSAFALIRVASHTRRHFLTSPPPPPTIAAMNDDQLLTMQSMLGGCLDPDNAKRRAAEASITQHLNGHREVFIFGLTKLIRAAPSTEVKTHKNNNDQTKRVKMADIPKTITICFF